MSRHEQELGLAVKPESDETKLFMFALSCQQQETPTDLRPPEHPINQLKELEQQMFGHLRKKKRKKTKKTSPMYQKEPVTAPASSTVSSQDSTAPVQRAENLENSSLWDCKEPVTAPACSKIRKTPAQVSSHKYTCQPKTLYTIRNGKIVRVTDVPQQPKREEASYSGQPFVLCDTTPPAQYRVLTREEIMGQRLSMDEIKTIARFENYEPGLPSKVLFVKNLAKQVTEADLVSVFGHLEDPGAKRIIYRLMAGKMKGQAFVTFPSTEKSTSALETVNGFLLHDKPIVIQYGHSTGLE